MEDRRLETARLDTPRWSQMTERAWDLSRQAQRFVHARPLQTIALTIGVGFVVGKILSGREK
jgi:ElaB/YqjD/DUF883 family membrane-anchored ribosome-binding protein